MLYRCILLLGIATAFSTRAATVRVAWDPSDTANIAGYYLYVQSTELRRITNRADQTTATVSNLVAGVRYTLYATAFDAIGLESIPSNSIQHTPTNAAPQGLRMEIARTSQGAGMELRASGAIAPVYYLQTTTNLANPQWTDVQVVTPSKHASQRCSATKPDSSVRAARWPTSSPSSSTRTRSTR